MNHSRFGRIFPTISALLFLHTAIAGSNSVYLSDARIAILKDRVEKH